MKIRCTKCGSDNWIKAGWGWRKGKKDVQRYRCKNCGRIFVLSNGEDKNKVGGLIDAGTRR